MTVKELKNADGDKYMTAEEAAGMLGVKEGAIRNYLSEGKLTTFKFKTLTLVSADEVKRWKARQRGR